MSGVCCTLLLYLLLLLCPQSRPSLSDNPVMPVRSSTLPMNSSSFPANSRNMSPRDYYSFTGYIPVIPVDSRTSLSHSLSSPVIFPISPGFNLSSPEYFPLLPVNHPTLRSDFSSSPAYSPDYPAHSLTSPVDSPSFPANSRTSSESPISPRDSLSIPVFPPYLPSELWKQVARDTGPAHAVSPRPSKKLRKKTDESLLVIRSYSHEVISICIAHIYTIYYPFNCRSLLNIAFFKTY